MADLVIVSVILAFTALCVAYISWCDRIIGSDELRVDEPAEPRAEQTAMAS